MWLRREFPRLSILALPTDMMLHLVNNKEQAMILFVVRIITLRIKYEKGSIAIKRYEQVIEV